MDSGIHVWLRHINGSTKWSATVDMVHRNAKGVADWVDIQCMGLKRVRLIPTKTTARGCTTTNNTLRLNELDCQRIEAWDQQQDSA